MSAEPEALEAKAVAAVEVGRLAFAKAVTELGKVYDELATLDVCIEAAIFGPAEDSAIDYRDARESLHAVKERVRLLLNGLKPLAVADAPSATSADANVISLAERRRASEE